MGDGPGGANKVSRDIIGQYSISDITSSKEDIKSMFKLLDASGGVSFEDGRLKISKDAAKIATDTTRELLDRIEIPDEDARDMYKDISAGIKGHKYYISPQDRHDAGREWSEYARNGELKVTTKQRPGMRSVNSLYTELADQYPSVFDGGITHAGDQLKAINSSLKGMKKSSVKLSRSQRQEWGKELRNELLRQYALLRGIAG